MADYSSKNTPLKTLNKKVEDLNTLMVAVVIVLFIGFAAAFIAVGGMVMSSMSEFRGQLQSQNDKIDALTKVIQNEQKTVPASN
jgi:Sec-independent protein translocase protein TatA